MSEHMQQSERVCYEGLRSLGFLATSEEYCGGDLDDLSGGSHRDVKVVEEGQAIGVIVRAMTVHLKSRRLQREACEAMRKIGVESAENSLALADQGYSKRVTAALHTHPESLALAYSAAECVSALCKAVIDPCNVNLEDIQIEEEEEEEEEEGEI